jgi:hypothetical protein
MAVAAVAAGFCSSLYAADTAALAKRLHNAAELSSLDDPALKPWHLKLAVQLYDAKGNPSEQGTIEEWWAPGKDKIIYATPSYNATEINDGKSVYRTKGQPDVPYLLDEAVRFVVNPMVPAEIISRSELRLQVQSFGQVKLDCIMLSKPGNASARIQAGQVPTFCLEPGVDQLRVSWNDPEVSTRNSIGLFQERRVGIDTSISLYGAKAASQHIEALDSKPFDVSIFTPGTDLEDRSDDPIWVSAAASSGMLTYRAIPTFPEEAKVKHMSGTVMLFATIGTDGRVLSTDAVGNPEPIFVKPTIAAVKQWIYTPHLMNGVAVKMKTSIAIRYNFFTVP